MKGFLDGCSEEDIHWVATHLREEDKRACGDFEIDPEEAFLQTLWTGNIRAMVVSDGENMETVGLFGWYSTGYLWMAATPRLYDFSKQFAKLSKRMIDGILGIYPQIYCYVDDRNPQDLRFAEWLGFEDYAPVLVNDQLYHTYVRT